MGREDRGSVQPGDAGERGGEYGILLAVWYRRSFERPALRGGKRLLLHFGAVDYSATVWVNGVRVGAHEGGYTPFSVDMTDVLRADGAQEVVVRAEDDPADLAKPRGQAGLEAGAALDLVSANDGDLADGVDGGGSGGVC